MALACGSMARVTTSGSILPRVEMISTPSSSSEDGEPLSPLSSTGGGSATMGSRFWLPPQAATAANVRYVSCFMSHRLEGEGVGPVERGRHVLERDLLDLADHALLDLGALDARLHD